MGAYDEYAAAAVYEGNVYCIECLPVGVDLDDDEVVPILATEEWDAPATCEACGLEHDYMQIAY
jgi:hypothetical protein